MKKFLLAVAALLCVGSVAMAGVNQNGTVLFHYNGAATGTDGIFAGYGGLTACEGAVTTAPTGAGIPGAWFAYAAFLPTDAPRVSVITAGLLYDENNIFLGTWGKTADGELPTTSPAWPLNGSGIAVQWDHAVTSTLFEWYWFTGYGYQGQICLGPHPTQGGGFTDDAIPATTDPIAAYGCLGFGEAGVLACPIVVTPHSGACCLPDGSCIFVERAVCDSQGGVYQGDDIACNAVACPQPPVYGACCSSDHICTITTQADCQGTYQGDDTTCDPDPCVTPVQKSTWGEIKHNFR
jgi:hypothetical protein